ncbi:unnamed protein product [Cylicocyclus nassatus]|uniref:Uncharacterized protein n=1 Tax=Cylicocyclus nassatus TaxID=53992 RepID=A0AA36M9I6_CYLNA|nr:unnamed protein product [Cylicocyclus nassatus]
MAAAISLTILLLMFVNTIQAKNLMELYAYCYSNAEDMASLKRGETPTPEKLPEWCITMRNDVAPCIIEKFPMTDDGSIASRGNVLLTFYKIAKDERILTHVKLYHYGCLYNSWHNYLADDECYKQMLSQCVRGNQSCYYVPCGGGDEKHKVYKVLSSADKESEPPKSSACGVIRYLVTISLMALLYVV